MMSTDRITHYCSSTVHTDIKQLTYDQLFRYAAL